MKDKYYMRNGLYFLNGSFRNGFLVLGLLLSILLINKSAIAQEITISGTVLSADNQAPLPGVNILEVGTQRGTTTNAEGEFSLKVSGADATLRFTFIGYAAKNVALDG